MKRLILILRKLLLLGIIVCQYYITIGQSRPNVVVILTDDQGTIDLNNYGAKDLHTPHIDALANSGVKFTQFYAGAPICSPSRAALLTGLNPHAAGLPSNTSSIPGGKGMPTEKITMAEVFKEAGYQTGHIGKWHLGFSPETMPLAQGFDYSFGHMGGCIDNYSHFFYWNGPNRHDLYENGIEVFQDGTYFPDLIASKADTFINNQKSNPFFLYYAINLPHYPLQATEKWRDYYKDLKHPRKDYAACVSVIDEKVGQLRQTLKELNILDNTIIIFQSDHGHSMEERAFNGGGSAGNYRGAKTSLFEGGIRVPAIISYPKEIPEAQVRDQICISMDWFATVAEYCNIKTHKIEGKSLIPIIENSKANSLHKVLRWKQGVRWAIRKGAFKLLGLPNDPTNKYKLDPAEDQLFLTKPEEDPTEQFNLAKKYPEETSQLLKEYMEWEYATKEDIPSKAEDIPTLALGKEIELVDPPNPKYACDGPGTLINSKCGTRYFNDGQWLGFQEKDLEAVIDLGEKLPLEKIKIGMLQDAASWIFYPKSVSYAFSNDGINYSENLSIEFDELKDMRAKVINRVVLPLMNIKAQFIKVKIINSKHCPDWHPNKGGKAWLFVDEISIQ